MMQTTIDFTARRENNPESQAILNANKERINSQCHRVLELLLNGEKLTVRDAMIKYGIGDLRRRVADLIEQGVPVKKEVMENRFKVYYL